MLARKGQQPDRADAEILQDLRAETDLAPLPAARLAGRCLVRFRNSDHRHAGGAVAQHHQHAPALGLEALQRRAHGFGAAEHIEDEIGAMQPRRHCSAVADVAVDEGHVIERIERRQIGVAGRACRSRIRPEIRRRARPACSRACR